MSVCILIWAGIVPESSTVVFGVLQKRILVTSKWIQRVTIAYTGSIQVDSPVYLPGVSFAMKSCKKRGTDASRSRPLATLMVDAISGELTLDTLPYLFIVVRQQHLQIVDIPGI